MAIDTETRVQGTVGAQEKLRVIIVGGSVSGLTLAHCLYHNDIEFVILEAGAEIAPEVGASIVVLPNGSRILDQIGVFDDVLAEVEPLNNGLTWTADGKLVVEGNSPILVRNRTGYPVSFLTRRKLLQIISNHLPDKSKVLTSKRVSSIEHSASGVAAICEDGSKYSGDIIVGADGVRSLVRSLMHQHRESKEPGSTLKDQTALSAEYNCIFGFGDPVEGHLVPGDSHRTYDKNYSTLTFVGKGGKLFWFLFTKLDKRYYGKDIPRYTKEDVEQSMKPFFKMRLTNEITFDKVWETRNFANMVCVEEGQFETWTSDRFVCLGDSIHKMTPNFGAGGNAAIESAAALANSLSHASGTSLSEIQRVLNEFYNKRHSRVNQICDVANQLTRIEALDTFIERIVAMYAIPVMGDFLADITTDGIVGAEILDALPVPARAKKATMAWDQGQGIGYHEKKWKRALYALPLLAVLYGCQRTMAPSMAQVVAQLVPKVGTFPLSDGKSVPIWGNYFGLKALDKIMSIYVGFFTPGIGNLDPAGRSQMIAFLGDLVPIQAIWMIEGIRRGNFTTAAHLLPTLMGFLYQMKGIGFIAPLYFFLHYVQSPLENFHAADNRLTQVGPAKTIVPTITLSYILPSLAMMTARGLSTRQWINGLFWQPFPIYAALLQRLLSSTVKDTTIEDRINNVEADVPYLRYAYGFSTAAATLANLYVRLTNPTSLINVFFKGVSSPTASVSLVEGIARTLRYDQLATFSAGAIWTMLHFRDLKKANKLQASWGKIVGIFAGVTAVAGPGAAMGLMWAWREEILAGTSRPLSQQGKSVKVE